MHKSSRQLYVEQLLEAKLTLSRFTHEMAKEHVYVVNPGEVTSLVYLSDESRFYPITNEEDIVVGGNFG